jgi:hypothetical protein
MTGRVLSASRSRSVSPMQRITFKSARSAAPTFSRTCSLVSLKYWRRSECPTMT